MKRLVFLGVLLAYALAPGLALADDLTDLKDDLDDIDYQLRLINERADDQQRAKAEAAADKAREVGREMGSYAWLMDVTWYLNKDQVIALAKEQYPHASQECKLNWMRVLKTHGISWKPQP